VHSGSFTTKTIDIDGKGYILFIESPTSFTQKESPSVSSAGQRRRPLLLSGRVFKINETEEQMWEIAEEVARDDAKRSSE
jgi:hypothetical protein